MMYHRVGQCRLGLARRRMHREIRRLVHHQQVVVLVHNVQRQRRALDAHRVRRHTQPHRLPRAQSVDGPHRHAVGSDALRHLLQLDHHPPRQSAVPPQKRLHRLPVRLRRHGIRPFLHTVTPQPRSRSGCRVSSVRRNNTPPTRSAKTPSPPARRTRARRAPVPTRCPTHTRRGCATAAN